MDIIYPDVILFVRFFTNVTLARFKKEYEGLTKNAPPFNLFIYIYKKAS